MFILVVFFTICTIATTYDASLFLAACDHIDRPCFLYKIDIDLLNSHAISNEIMQWYPINVADRFGSVVGFKDQSIPCIMLTTDCDYHAYLINIT
ncbi:unnamed protein product [Rotaria magnacalcarata]|uniref:Uncharacterized protein n=1 Tax=Rotaria magnacalcarata TaxID=392030 RepID=A0A820AXJ0_9BILA|nr:unnamed protein product [Rotaria magnacalcarata]CAF2048677.1 unnamed protein product [Rotaria magnacalcarata]CAF2210138.1 unnamed protein product [Rotaria magnacalcarata]CAF4192157.1 unnamed protein product [Rotaria magnacalcarata]CAF4202620.1 unnamed protein product [Rotaria magnacalcarata]